METHTIISSSEESLSMVMMKILESCFPNISIIKPPHRTTTTSYNNSEKETSSQPVNDNNDNDMDTPDTPDDEGFPIEEQQEDSKNSMQLFQDEMYTPQGDDDDNDNEDNNNSNNEKANSKINNILHKSSKNLIKHPFCFNGIELILNIKNIHSHNDIWSPLILHDKRIATVSSDNSISICKIDYNNKTYIQEIKKTQAHSSSIFSICELNDGRLITCSIDMSIKIWNVHQNEIKLLKTLMASSAKSSVWKVITLTHSRFASCSIDGSITIWNSNNYKEIISLSNSSSVYSIIQLTNLEILVSSCGKPSIDFWDLTTYKKLKSIKNIHAVENSHMIELQSGCIAISSYSSNFPIVIIDPVSYTIIEEIMDKDYIKSNSSLIPWGDNTFIYIKGNYFVQFSTSNYEIIYKAKLDMKLDGYSGMAVVGKDKYLIIQNDEKGISVLKPY